MQELLQTLISDLHALYFKPNGFKKQRGRFTRQVDTAIQEVGFQSSAWNSVDQPIAFYVNVGCGFTDIPMNNGKAALPGMGRLGGLALGAPAQFGLEATNYAAIRVQLLRYIPVAVNSLPSHYEVIRARALQGYSTHIPLPDNWEA